MLGHIKDVIGEKCKIINEAINVDEEQHLIAFEVNDLAAIIQDVIRTCADCCTDEQSREAILQLCN
jgi:hypothetical protein